MHDQHQIWIAVNGRLIKAQRVGQTQPAISALIRKLCALPNRITDKAERPTGDAARAPLLVRRLRVRVWGAAVCAQRRSYDKRLVEMTYRLYHLFRFLSCFHR